MAGTTSQRRPDPAWDPAVRWRVQFALSQLIRAAQDVVTRYSRDGIYEAPDPVTYGDVIGLITVGDRQVVRRLQAQLDETRAVMAAVEQEINAYRRERLAAYREGATP